MPLTSEQHEQYLRDGYILIRGLIDADTLEQIDARFHSLAMGTASPPEDMVIMKDVAYATGDARPETPLHAIMVPRNRVQTIPADADRRTLVRITRRRGHARLPVYESNHRQIIGVVRVDELLRSEDWKTVSQRLQPVIRLRPHDTVASAMIRLQRAGHGLAVVTDPGGRLLGVVALKDLLAEVVGEFPSED